MKEASISLLAAVLAVALLSACGSDDESTVVKTVTKPPPHPLHLTQFQSPTHNIGCYLSSQQGGSVRCDIREHAWTAPPKPAYCDVDWGGGLQVGSKRRGSIVCAGDTVLDPGSQVLAYGQASEAGPIVCRSSEVGVRCSNILTGHGFIVSRQSYALF